MAEEVGTGPASAMDKGTPAELSPDWWLLRLDKKLTQRQPEVRLHDDYYEGEHRMAFATERFRQVFGSLFARFNDNWCELIVDAAAERLHPQGIRIPAENPDDSAAEDTTGDDEAWDIWQRNQLDAYSQIAHTDSLVFGESYGLVWWEDGSTDRAAITIESPRQAYVETQGRTRRAGIKRWVDDSGFVFATAYLPDGLYKYKSTSKASAEGTLPSELRYVRREVQGEPWPLKNPLGAVNLVPIRNRPRLLKPGASELKKVIPIQDAINKLCADMLVASEFAAFRQRVVIGAEVPRDPETGEAVPFDWKAFIDRIWMLEPQEGGSDPRVQEFSAADLSNHVKAIEMFVQHTASQTRTPPHYFYLAGNLPSGETIKSAETGLVAKVRTKMLFLGEDWEEIIRLGLAVEGSPKAKVMNSEMIWGDPESRSESQHVDAVMKMQTLGVPQEALWEELDFSPQQIKRFLRMRQEEAIAVAAAYEAFGGQVGVPPAQAAGQPPPPPAPPPNAG